MDLFVRLAIGLEIEFKCNVSANMVFTLGPPAHLASLATGVGVGTISLNSESTASFTAVS